MKIFKKISRVLLVGIFVLTLSGCTGCVKDTPAGYRVQLEMWGVFDDSDAYGQIYNSYQDMNSHASLKYRKFTVDEYKDDLIDALATGNGPDIFMIHSSWLPQFQDKITPVDPTMIPESVYRKNFVDVVAQDFLLDGQIYAAPLSVDSLALYYNKDLFNFAGIVAPPKTWEEFNETVKTLTQIGSKGEIERSGAAIGTAYNINRSTDILSALMFQGGAELIDGNSIELGSQVRNALTYYTQFADVQSSLYTWNPRLHYSLDAFYEGKVAMMINYSWHYETIKRKNAKMNYAVAELPQSGTGGQIANYSNYWAFAVSKSKIDESSPDPILKNKARIHESWQFLKYLTLDHGGKITLTNAVSDNQAEFNVSTDPAKMYLEKTGKPAARRDIIEEQKLDPVLGPFVYGNLVSRSWYQPDAEAIESILAEMINSVNIGSRSVTDAIDLAEDRIQTFYGR